MDRRAMFVNWEGAMLSMLRVLTSVAIMTVLGLTPGAAQAPRQAEQVVVTLDPALDAIISTDAKLERLKEDYFGATEGPVWSREGGYLLFSDMAANRVYKWAPGSGLSVFLERSGFTGSELPIANVVNNGRLNVALIGSNGLTFDREGRLILCTHGDRTLVRIEKDGTRTILADRYEGKRLNGPNDVVMRKSDGALYFSDLGSGLRGGSSSPQRELDFTSIMRWRDGKLDVVDRGDGKGNANGLAFSPNEKYLYTANANRIVRYDVQTDGTLASPHVLIDMTSDTSKPGAAEGYRPDGLKVDLQGNVFTGGPGGIWIVSPAGKLLGKIRLPVRAANLAFGDPDGRGLYLTCRSNLFHIRLNARAI